MWRRNISTGVGFTDKAVWSRASRRQVSKAHNTDNEEEEDEDMALGFKIHIGAGEVGEDGTRVTVRWLKDHDSVLFESFCGMITGGVCGTGFGRRAPSLV
jgi:23S rRNA (adenine1618-N6)-methyltransferase